ncbi:MAG TPA: FtsX-like permease family protein [Candidatus Dormibacteraeota bacterium]|nr:FtsX-like permease family protein [Candidatus Dormibacteraeota bacterium]
MSLAAVLIGLFLLTYGVLAVIAFRRPLLARLAYREAIHRPWQTVLVIAGLTVGTALILMAQINGDSMSNTLTAATYKSWGRVDLLVTANGDFFSSSLTSRLAADPRVHGSVRGVQSGVEVVGSVADLDQSLDKPTVRLIGFDPQAQAPFGSFTLNDGRTTTGGELGATGVLLSQSLADSIQSKIGDRLRVTFGQVVADYQVAGIARSEGPGAYGSQPALFGTLDAFAPLAGTGRINVVRISAVGDGSAELENSQRIAPAITAALHDVAGSASLTMRTAKADDINEITKLADAERPVTFALGVVIVLAGIALVVNLALALAEERRPRLAVLRALGLSRAGLVIASVLEGAIYALAAAAVGAVPGIAAAWLIVSSAGSHVPEIQEKNATIVFSVSMEAIAASIAAGALITVATLVAASIRTTRMTIASAVRALPEPPSPRQSGALRIAGLALIAVASLAALLNGDPNLRLIGGVGAILSIGLALRGRLPNRVRATIVGVGTAVWLVVIYGQLTTTYLSYTSQASAGAFITVATLALGVAALATVVAVNMRAVERFVPRSLVAQLTRRPSKLWLATSSVGLVLALFTFIGMFIASSAPDYYKDAGGFDVSVLTAGISSPNLTPALQSKIAQRVGVSTREYLGPARSSWSVSGEPVDWHQQLLLLYTLTDSQLAGPLPALADRDARFSSDAAVFAAVRSDPTIVVSGIYRSGTTLSLVGRDGPVRLTVAGGYKAGFLPGIVGSSTSMSPFSAAPEGTTLLLKLTPGVDPAAFALDVRRSLFPSGVDAVATSALLDAGSAPLRNFAAEAQLLIIGGLLVGVLSLGILAMRAVVERRRSIGVLRAVGFQARGLMLAVVGESLLMAAGGIVVGLVVGLILGSLFVPEYLPSAQITVQFGLLAIVVALILLTAAAVTVLPALAVARTAPAEALRMAD